MCNSYTTWIFHAESIGSNNESPDETVKSDDLELANASRHDNVGGLMEDLVYESGNFPFFFVFPLAVYILDVFTTSCRCRGRV